jgi:hypothetical protein
VSTIAQQYNATQTGELDAQAFHQVEPVAPDQVDVDQNRVGSRAIPLPGSSQVREQLLLIIEAEQRLADTRLAMAA